MRRRDIISAQLLDQAASGDEDARRQLLERPREKLKQTLTRLFDARLNARLDLSDIVQDSLTEAAQRLDDYLRDRPVPYLAWLKQIAYERLIDANRKHIAMQRRSVIREEGQQSTPSGNAVSRFSGIVDDLTSPSQHVLEQERITRLVGTLNRLRPQDRDIILMRHIDGIPLVEIAARLNISVDACKARALRAIQRLRTLLETNPDRSTT